LWGGYYTATGPSPSVAGCGGCSATVATFTGCSDYVFGGISCF
jgi:hypothetical protein